MHYSYMLPNQPLFENLQGKDSTTSLDILFHCPTVLIIKMFFFQIWSNCHSLQFNPTALCTGIYNENSCSITSSWQSFKYLKTAVPYLPPPHHLFYELNIINSLNFFSLSNPIIIFIAHFWIPSSFSTPFLKFGDQNCTQYSNWGLTYAE